MKRTFIVASLGLLAAAAIAQDTTMQVTYECSIDENCSSGSCVENSPPFEFSLIHDKDADTGTVLFGDQAADTIAVNGMGTQEFMQLLEASSVSFSIREATGRFEVRAHGPAGSTLEKGLCKFDS